MSFYLSTPVQVHDLVAASGRIYQIGYGLNNGASVYVDRKYIYESVPNIYKGGAFIRTFNDDKFNQSRNFSQFRVTQPVTVYVMHDDRHSIRPSWMNSFYDTGDDVIIKDRGSGRRWKSSIFGKNFPAGTVTLGGNYPDRNVGNNSMYTVAVLSQDLRVTGLAVKSKRFYEVVPRGLQVGSKMYSDRDYIYGYVSPSLQGKTYIRTANDDKLNRSKEFLSFRLSEPGVVYVAHDDRHSTRPSWLDEFSDTGELVVLRAGVDGPIHTFSVFAKKFPAGNVTLGGNYPDRDVGNNSMYVVVISD